MGRSFHAACATCLLIVAGCKDAASPDTSAPVPQPVAVASSGEELFGMYCSLCHGAEGRGDGVLKLDRPARNFVDGGFSFGNTQEAIERTIAGGIPGSPMPPYVDALKEEEIARLATFVRSLAPTTAEASSDQTELIVGDRPIIVRGMLGPVIDEMAMWPRGLVVGNPDGRSYVYRADDVRLLAVRQGRFVGRADWNGRGGAPLELLGTTVADIDDGDGVGMFATAAERPLRSVLLETSTLGAQGSVRYALAQTDGSVVGTVTESCRGATVDERAVIAQHLEIDASQPIIVHIPASAQRMSGGHTMTLPAGKTAFILTHAVGDGP